MESIGELAQRTGTSRRMLRHWETIGLLTPAHIDPSTNRRSYAPAQAGRVRAIVALRANGFGLDAIRDLLDQGLTKARLIDLLRERESELVDRIEHDSLALRQVRERLESLEKGHHTIMNTLTMTTLPALRFAGVTEVVTDETEIPGAVERLLELLGVSTQNLSGEVVLIYDGTTDESIITVSAALSDSETPAEPDRAATTVVSVGDAHSAVVARFDERPLSTGDAWIALDARLETAGLRTTGPYRQTLHAGGAMSLAAPVVELE